MANKELLNRKANEAVSKFKLLSAYGGPGSLIHTAYGSVIISCIEEWGFMNKVIELHSKAVDMRKPEKEYVADEARYEDIYLSNDERLLAEIARTKGIGNLRYLVLMPDIELHDHWGTIVSNRSYLAINSEYMPKGFYDKNNHLKTYNEWYKLWPKDDADFSPPKYIQNITSVKKERTYEIITPLKQDNIVLICKNGHMSDFPWSRFLRWRLEQPHDLNQEVDLFKIEPCCSRSDIQISETSANASGFDGKWLKCNNPGCTFAKGTSLKGIMSLKICCPGHRPWESETGRPESYAGKPEVRRASPPAEKCERRDLKVALTTGNNLYFSRILSSIFMPTELFLDKAELKIRDLKAEMQEAKKVDDFDRCIVLNKQIKDIEAEIAGGPGEIEVLTDAEREVRFRYQEFTALTERSAAEINVQRRDLLVHDTTGNLDAVLSPFFERVLRIDRLKVTSAQLDFSRVEPYESGTNEVLSRNIFRASSDNVLAYPVVENYGEGIFFAFNKEAVNRHVADLQRLDELFDRERNDFAEGAKAFGEQGGWQLYMIHTFCHLIMRELEFRCGYPTASLSERLFVSADTETEMYGLLIYTAEGAEGSMGGLIAQTREKNLNDLIKSALLRATICNSDPLCWQSEGQGLFELNLAACFSCGLVSETSCEQRNIYLDRQVVIDEQYGFFKDIMDQLR